MCLACAFAPAERAGWTKTARRYVKAAPAPGLVKGWELPAVTNELIGVLVEQARPVRPDGHGPAWAFLAGRREGITSWVGEGFSIVKVHELPTRSATSVPYRTVHQFAASKCGFTGRRRTATVRVIDGDPCGVPDRLRPNGLLTDPDTGRRRKVHAQILTAVVSRHMYAHMSFGQRLEDVIAGCEAALDSSVACSRSRWTQTRRPAVRPASPCRSDHARFTDAGHSPLILGPVGVVKFRRRPGVGVGPDISLTCQAASLKISR